MAEKIIYGLILLTVLVISSSTLACDYTSPEVHDAVSISAEAL